MRSILPAILLVAMLAVGCLGTDSGNPSGPAECRADADCREACEALVQEAAPLAASPYQFTGARCELIAIAGESGPAPGCSCELGEGGSISLVGGSADPCLYYGRDRTCLYGRDELPACSLDEPASCDAACDDLQARLDADARRALEVELRLASCHAPGAGSRCECVVRIEDACYVSADLTSYDCALSDAAILAMHPDPAPPIYPPCSQVGGSEPGGTCIDDSDPLAESCLYPRDPAEWQGMRVNMCLRALCETSAGCGLAAACLPDGMCGPCARDADCAAGESCVLDYCVLSENVGCRSRADCGGEHCLLSGLCGSPRNNEAMFAYCASDERPPRCPE